MIPTQEETNWTDPKEHFLWALRNLPTIAGIGAVTHPGFLKAWSEHLWNCGFAHRDYLSLLADEEGYIHVSQLPAQVARFQPAPRGPRHAYNNAARWATPETPEPEPIRLPDIRELTLQENAAMIQQYVDAGMIPDPQAPPPPMVAEEVE